MSKKRRSYRKSGEYDTPFGQFVRKRMRQLGMSRFDLARRLAVTPHRVSQLFSYKHYPQAKKLARLARVLDVTKEQLTRAALRSLNDG